MDTAVFQTNMYFRNPDITNFSHISVSERKAISQDEASGDDSACVGVPCRQELLPMDPAERFCFIEKLDKI